MNLFVAKLSSDTNEASLQALFEGIGEVKSVKIIMDRDTGESKCFGFVEMADSHDANTAINELDGTEFEGRNIVVKVSEPKRNDNRNRGGGFRPRENRY